MDIVDSITDFKYSKDGRYIVARDFLTLKLWDVAMEREPVHTYRIHDFLCPHLAELYDNECIFDRFECAISHNNAFVLSGGNKQSNNGKKRDINDETTDNLSAARIRER